MNLTILNFNTLGLPFITKNYNQRFAILIEELGRIKPDVVCLQEVWAFYTKKKIISALRALGYPYYCAPESKYRFNGLVTLSKYEITESRFCSLKPRFSGFNSSLLEIPGDKGYLLTRLKIGAELLDIHNVHLNTDFSSCYKEGSRYGTVCRQALATLTTDLEKSDVRKAILCGDFNFNPASFLYKELVQKGQLVDRVPASYKTLTQNLFHFPFPLRGGRVDYIFSRGINDQAINSVELVWNTPLPQVGYLSDHAGLIISLVI